MKPVTKPTPAVGKPAASLARERHSSPERLASAITKGILSRRYAVGQRLTELDLAQAFDVGRSTVREGLRLLAASGVVELQPHRGAVVRELNSHEAEDLLQVLEVLAGLAARLAAQRIDHGDYRIRFAEATRQLLAAGNGKVLGAMLDQRAGFYQVMFDIGGSTELQRVMPLSRAHLLRTQFHGALTAADLRAMHDEYQGISEAVLGGSAALAESRMRAHIRKSGKRSLPGLRRTPRE
jgi:DNA-binding GntR family transcriptional regulator